MPTADVSSSVAAADVFELTVLDEDLPPPRTSSTSAAAADVFEVDTVDEDAPNPEMALDSSVLIDLMFDQELFDLEVPDEGEILLLS